MGPKQVLPLWINGLGVITIKAYSRTGDTIKRILNPADWADDF